MTDMAGVSVIGWQAELHRKAFEITWPELEWSDGWTVEILSDWQYGYSVDVDMFDIDVYAETVNPEAKKPSTEFGHRTVGRNCLNGFNCLDMQMERV